MNRTLSQSNMQTLKQTLTHLLRGFLSRSKLRSKLRLKLHLLPPTRLQKLGLPLLASMSIAACGSTPITAYLHPYRPDVQQGNIVTRDMVEQLRPGMTRDQVRFLLGTPMLNDIFHAERWDYTYFLRRGNGEEQVRRLSVVFSEGKLARFESDPMPTEPLADTLILGRTRASR
jgi:outer membrane protein assembly factor BamE